MVTQNQTRKPRRAPSHGVHPDRKAVGGRPASVGDMPQNPFLSSKEPPYGETADPQNGGGAIPSLLRVFSGLLYAEVAPLPQTTGDGILKTLAEMLHRFLRWCVVAVVFSCSFLTCAYSQANCRDTSEGRVCSIQQPIVNGTLVDAVTQQNLGLVTVGGGCSGTLVNRFWVLTADHCVTSTGTVNGPSAVFGNVAITAAWSTRRIIPTRFERRWGASAMDVALIYLGGDDFGNDPVAPLQSLFISTVNTTLNVMKFGRGISAYAQIGPPPVPAVNDGRYRFAVFRPNAASATSYTLPVNAASQVGNGGDSGGPDFVIATDGSLTGIAGVQSTCLRTGLVPGQLSSWTWTTSISSCTSAAIINARDDILRIILQEPANPCLQTSAACAILETTALTLMLH